MHGIISLPDATSYDNDLYSPNLDVSGISHRSRDNDTYLISIGLDKQNF